MSPSIWGLVLFVFNFSLWERWGHWEGLLWTDVGFVLTFLAAGSSCEAPGKASLGINSWEVLSTSTALPDSPPHTTRFSQNFCARCWSLWCSWLVTGSKDIFTTWAQHKAFLTLPGLPHSSPLPLPEHKEPCGSEWCTWPKNEGFSLARRFVFWPWEFGLRYPRWSSNPQFQPLLKEMHPTCLSQVANCPGELFVPLHSHRKDLD